MISNHFIHFKHETSGVELPKKFTFPFYYEPHPLALIAVEELQEYLSKQTDFEHNFGLSDTTTGMVIGKMFGVLVVRNEQGELGYLAAFSGKLAGSNIHKYFVPPIFDMLKEDGFFRQNERLLNEYNAQIESLEKSDELSELQSNLVNAQLESVREISEWKERIRLGKLQRKVKRSEIANLNEDLGAEQLEELRKESVREQYFLKDLQRSWKQKIFQLEEDLEGFKSKIQTLKLERKNKSAEVQNQLFDQYYFLNANNKKRSVLSIFQELNDIPPAGAGECAAPKLLQYAYLHNFKPIALAEFWWGASPASEVRKHKQFYPACKRKCEPILGHMLQGLSVDENPMLINPAIGKELQLIFEDDYLLAVNKPSEFLSVPGKTIEDSVYSRMKEKYPDATGPLLVHRLDMSTSGILLIAKTKEVHKKLQAQFIKRTVKKRYTALLDGIVKQTDGRIDLPLRVDLDDRPRQMVCYEHGKNAITEWNVLSIKKGQTRVHFYPITGRTHQLRVHAAHRFGLNAPIVGDDLYGTKADRLHLHAGYLDFMHPVSRERIILEVDADF